MAISILWEGYTVGLELHVYILCVCVKRGFVAEYMGGHPSERRRTMPDRRKH